MKQIAVLVVAGISVVVLSGSFSANSGSESGSETAPGPRRFFFFDEAGSTEAGSFTPYGPPGAEAGSAESGSAVRAGGERFRGGLSRIPADGDETGGRLYDVMCLILALLTALVLVAAAFCLFRIGLWRPYEKESWTRRMNLSSEIGQQMDVFLVAAYREEWDICRRALAALNDLNGQRMILLSDESNRRVLEFIAAAVDCRARRDDANCLPSLRLQQVRALTALRAEIGQKNDLSETLLRSLRDTRYLYRPLRNDE